MKPSPRKARPGFAIGAALVLAALDLAALTPVAAEAAPAGRMLGMPVFRGARSPGVHPSRQGRAGVGHQGAFRHRPPGPALSGFTWPQYWSGPLPAGAPYPDWQDFPAAPAAMPPWFGPPPVAPCSPPLVINVSKAKPARHLPRVVYGTASACPD